MHSGDIRDQSRKLWEIAPDFERFSPSQILGAGLPKVPKIVPTITLGSRRVVWIKICDDIQISLEVIDVHTLNFNQILNFYE